MAGEPAAVPVAFLGVPTSMGSFAPGQEKAPRALRAAGLLPALAARGVQVEDRGDSPERRWTPDLTSPKAQNLAAVVEDAMKVRDRVADIVHSGQRHFVLGGNCSIEVGVVAGYVAAGVARVGLVYLDLHTDLNTPETTSEGALDWMGNAHLLDVPDAIPDLAHIGPRRPLLQPEDLVFWGVNIKGITPGERASVDRLGLRVVDIADAVANPTESMRALLDGWAQRYDAVLVHLDIDLVNFLDLPISENITRVGGASLAVAAAGLREALRLPNAVGFTLTEVNPDHDPDGTAVRALVATLADVLAVWEAGRGRDS
jgi:arginase